MVYKSFQELKVALIGRLTNGELKDRLLSFNRKKLKSLMVRATGKRRHSETKQQMADFILKYTSEQTVRRMLAFTTV